MQKIIESELIEPNVDSVTYGNYLMMDELLNLQHPLSQPPEPDEMLFIIIHQAYELWFKQILHETNQCMQMLQNNNLLAFLKGLTRITTIQDTLTKQVDILETMTPNDFNRFRERLNPASGFQSLQFRILEFALGCKYEAYLKFHKNDRAGTVALEKALASPTLYDHFLHYMHRQGFDIPMRALERDVHKIYEPCEEVVDVFFSIYQNPSKNYDVYLALEALADVDQKFLQWRYRHIAMVERMIGTRKGTGGSSGSKYLKTTLEKKYFPEIWELRNRFSGS